MPKADRPGPTEPKARLQTVDAIRGFALFGVLLVNMYNFGADVPEWSGVLDRIFRTGMHAILETKSWRLFSLLFGLGFSLQLAGALSQAGGSLWFYLRRLAVLFIFGMAHALFYDGDILMEYAMLGLILILFYKFPPRMLLILSFALLTAFPLGNLVYDTGGDKVDAYLEDALPLAERRVGHPYLASPMAVFRENAHAIPPRIWSNLQGAESSLATFSMFLLGLYLGRSRILHNVESHLPLVRSVFRWGIGIGAASALVEWFLGEKYGYAVFTESTASTGVRFTGDLLFAYGSTALALAYAAGIVLLAQRPRWKAVIESLQNLGRMALTAYLLSTLMFTTLFYGWGFGQLFLLGPAATTYYAVLFFMVLLAFCNWWLDRFRFGPAEWLWRSLSYRAWQPLRR